MSQRLPSLRNIEAFVTVANTLSYRLASENLNLSVSAISRRIIALEEELGAVLFVRGGHKLSLTPVGTRYRERVMQGLEIVRQATGSIENQDKEHITVLGLPSFLAAWLCPRLSSFLSAEPGLEIEFTTLRSRRLGNPDIVIEPRFQEVDSEELFKLFSWISVVVGREDLISENQVKEPGDICALYLVELSSAAPAWPSWLTQARIEDRSFNWLKFDSHLLAAAAVRGGLGLGLIPFFHLKEDPELSLPFKIASSIPGGVYLRSATGYQRPAVRRFREWFIDQVEATRRDIPEWARIQTGLKF